MEETSQTQESQTGNKTENKNSCECCSSGTCLCCLGKSCCSKKALTMIGMVALGAILGRLLNRR